MFNVTTTNHFLLVAWPCLQPILLPQTSKNVFRILNFILRAKHVHLLLWIVPFIRKVALCLAGLQTKWPLVLRCLPSPPMHSIIQCIWKVIAALRYNNRDGVIHACALNASISSV